MACFIFWMSFDSCLRTVGCVCVCYSFILNNLKFFAECSGKSLLVFILIGDVELIDIFVYIISCPCRELIDRIWLVSCWFKLQWASSEATRLLAFYTLNVDGIDTNLESEFLTVSSCIPSNSVFSSYWIMILSFESLLNIKLNVLVGGCWTTIGRTLSVPCGSCCAAFAVIPTPVTGCANSTASCFAAPWCLWCFPALKRSCSSAISCSIRVRYSSILWRIFSLSFYEKYIWVSRIWLS